MSRQPQILICDDDSTFHQAVKLALKGKCDTRSAYNSDEAKVILAKNPIDLILLDVAMRTPDEGLSAIKPLIEIDPMVSIVMSSGRSDFETVRDAMRAGAHDYIVKDFEPDSLWHVLTRVLETKKLRQRTEQQNFEVSHHQRQHVLVGESAKIQTLRKMIEKVRLSPANVVIHGETGTGKEVVARQLRRTLPDGSLAPFIAVDSSTIQSTTAESLLFGHEKGAFTGADKMNKGIFEEAHGGIVYFDEIANMPLDIQAKLLRVIQEKEFVRLGSSKVIQSDFRVVCATNRDLEEMVREGAFKEDLLQRLNVLPIELSPLRERIEDIPLLIEHFLARQNGFRPGLNLTDEAILTLKAYPWPGNIRELSNMIAYVATMAERDEVDVADLPPKFRDHRHLSGQSQPVESDSGSGSFYDRVAKVEKEILNSEYARHEGNISRLALALGMDRSHLYTKLKEHGIHSPKK
ncbi:MAG: sigma-54-dependent transcriptional regulator [Bdellovibrionia bacterium]